MAPRIFSVETSSPAFPRKTLETLQHYRKTFEIDIRRTHYFASDISFHLSSVILDIIKDELRADTFNGQTQ